jgi:hypothetical protein
MDQPDRRRQCYCRCQHDITLNGNNFNYNPTLIFTGASTKRLTGAFGSIPANASLMFAVVKKAPSPGLNNDKVTPILSGPPGQGELIMPHQAARVLSGYMNNAAPCGSTTDIMNIPGIVRVDYNSTVNTTGATVAFNGLQSASACGTNTLAARNNIFIIGGGNTAAGIFAGEIAEVIHYDIDALPGGAADIAKIESYLALKYGLTLSNSGGGINGDYTSSAGTTIWTAATGSSYHNNVIGIGRDDNSALLQKQSHQADDAIQMYISATVANSNLSNTGSFSTDGQFVMMGNNNATSALNTANTEYPSSIGIVSRFDREWKITNTGFTGTFSLSILPSSGLVTAKIKVLIDDDGDFSNATVITPTVTVSGGRIVLTGISNAMIASGATKYITLAYAPTPGGVTDNSRLWTKADAGVVVSGVNVSQWNNYSGTGMTTEASIAASTDITLGALAMNYNPALIFSGASGKRLSGTFAAPSANPGLMFAVVKKAVSPNNTGTNPYSLGG